MRRKPARPGKSSRSKEEQRRYNMSRIKSTNTTIEDKFRKALWHEGLRYRKNDKRLPGKPDITIAKYQIAIFCDGEFWHGKDWESKKQKIKDNRNYWLEKIERNMRRDNEIDHLLQGMGWIVLRFWGGDIKKNLSACLEEVKEAILQVQMDSCDMEEATGYGG